METEVICSNRRARYDYHILETKEAGIVLVGTEVKSLRDHRATLDGSYAVVESGEVWLVDASIEPYSHGNRQNHESKRKRKLLLNKKEIRNFAEKADIKGNTLVPLSIYFKEGRAKVELAVCKGKQAHDKRQGIKKRDTQREMRSY